jgi:hypothetical protein
MLGFGALAAVSGWVYEDELREWVRCLLSLAGGAAMNWSPADWIVYSMLMLLAVMACFAGAMLLPLRGMKHRDAPPNAIWFEAPRNEATQLDVAWYQVSVRVSGPIDDCTAHLYMAGNTRDGPGIRMHWQSLSGGEPNGVPVLKLVPRGDPYRVPIVIRPEKRQRPAVNGAAYLSDAEYLNQIGQKFVPSNKLLPAESRHRIELVIKSKGEEVLSQRYEVIVPEINADQKEFVVRPLLRNSENTLS